MCFASWRVKIQDLASRLCLLQVHELQAPRCWNKMYGESWTLNLMYLKLFYRSRFSRFKLGNFDSQNKQDAIVRGFSERRVAYIYIYVYIIYIYIFLYVYRYTLPDMPSGGDPLGVRPAAALRAPRGASEKTSASMGEPQKHGST